MHLACFRSSRCFALLAGGRASYTQPSLKNGILWLLEDLFLARTVSITISFAYPISSGLPTKSLVSNERVVQDIGRYLDLLSRLVACDPASSTGIGNNNTPVGLSVK